MNTGAVGITTEDSPKRKPFLLAFDDISSQIKIRKNVSYVRPEFSKKHGAFRTSNNSEKNSFRAKGTYAVDFKKAKIEPIRIRKRTLEEQTHFKSN